MKTAIDYNNIPGADTRDMQMCMLQLGNIYVSQKNASALYPLIKALKQSFAISTTLHIRAETEKLEYHYFGLLNKPALALPKLEQSLALKDSLALLESSTIKQDITKELKDREQQLQISLLTKSNELSKSYTWFFAILAITTAAILLLVFYNYKQQKQNLNKQAQLNAAIMAQKTEIEGSLQKAYDANKARENVIQIMAHELRSPISGIAAISGTLLQNDGMNPSEQNELIALIEGTATKSYHLINELIETNSTRKLQLTKRQFDVKKLLEETINLLQFKAQDKKQVIQLHAPDGSIMVTADEEKMGRVFSNLLTNAIKFSPLQEKIRVTITPNSGYLQVAVIDNGKGIPQSQLKNIFNLFTSAQQTGTAGEKSFGIGLSVCKQIVEAHGGHIEVISTEGKGSTFTVQLPLTDNV
ncbi:MAG: sensor histidine kinase [Bacteroidetes bacterium]|nr:MAG: sensor histidine kinase [Bacteroidota bacterium]